VNRGIAVAAVLLLAAGRLLAQDAASSSQSPSSSDDIDNLFNGPGTTSGTGSAGSPAPGPSQPASAPDLRPDDPTRDNRLHFLSDLSIYGLGGVGWAHDSSLSDLEGGLSGEASGSLSANLGIDFRPAPELRVRGTLSYNFPQAGTQLSQLDVDYSVRNAVFFSLGIFGYTWGNAQFFQYGNLPSRALPGWSGVINTPLWQQLNILTTTVVNNYPASVKMYIPFGVDGFTFLARFDIANYGFPSPSTPDPRYAGYGMQLDLVTGPVQWTLSGYAQQLLAPRTSLDVKTSILGFDLSFEGIVAYPVNLETSDPQKFFTAIPTTGGGVFVGGFLQRIYPTAVVGLFREWTDPHIRLYAEYGYNGERDATTSWLADATGPGGHNTALALRFSNLFSGDVSLNTVWQQSWSDWSGLVSAFLEFSPVALTTIQFGPVFVYGIENGVVASNRLVPGDKRLELVLLVRVSDSFRQ